MPFFISDLKDLKFFLIWQDYSKAGFMLLIFRSLHIPDDPKKYSRLTKHQTISFCSITSKYLDSESIFLNLDFDTSTSQI